MILLLNILRLAILGHRLFPEVVIHGIITSQSFLFGRSFPVSAFSLSYMLRTQS